MSKILSMVARSTRLQPIINSNDKTPFTDGHIDVYSGPSKTKQDWRGRVSVQVKGRSKRGKPDSAPSHSVERSELEAFQEDGGVLYFYVTVDPQSGDCSPYYAVLTPFTIEHYLQKMQQQKTIAIRLSKLPHLPGQIERIVELALKGKQQRPSLGVDPSWFGQMRAITVFASSDLDLNVPVRLAPGEADFALEIRTSGGASIPVGGTLEIWPSDYVQHRTELSIGAGSTTYEQVPVRRIDP